MRNLILLLLISQVTFAQIADVTEALDDYKGKLSLGNACNSNFMYAEITGDVDLFNNSLELVNAGLNITGKLYYNKEEITAKDAIDKGYVRYLCDMSILTVEGSGRTPYYRKINVYKSSSERYLFVNARGCNLIKIVDSFGNVYEKKNTNRRRNRFLIEDYPTGNYVIRIFYPNLEPVIKKFEHEKNN